MLTRGNVIGVKISAINMGMALETIRTWVENKEKNYICVTPIHSIMDCHFRPKLKKIFNSSGLTTPDGMGVVYCMKLLGYQDVGRVYGPDLMKAVCSISKQQKYSHFFYGGSPGVAEKLKAALSKQFNGLDVCGTYSPPFRPLTLEEDKYVCRLINKANPDIVWVGISSPKQEIWMADHINKLNASVLIGVGAAFDYLSGNKKQAPVLIQHSGFEWLYRFILEPARLWKRYIKYPYFVLLFLGQLFTPYLKRHEGG